MDGEKGLRAPYENFHIEMNVGSKILTACMNTLQELPGGRRSLSMPLNEILKVKRRRRMDIC